MGRILIPDIAKLLDVELDEEFKIRSCGSKENEPGVYKLTLGEGLVKKNEKGVFDSNSSIEFEDLCLGNYEVAKLPWNPKKGEKVWTFVFNAGSYGIDWYLWNGDRPILVLLKSIGLIYRTKEKAIANFPIDFKNLTGVPLKTGKREQEEFEDEESEGMFDE